MTEPPLIADGSQTIPISKQSYSFLKKLTLRLNAQTIRKYTAEHTKLILTDEQSKNRNILSVFFFRDTRSSLLWLRLHVQSDDWASGSPSYRHDRLKASLRHACEIIGCPLVLWMEGEDRRTEEGPTKVQFINTSKLIIWLTYVIHSRTLDMISHCLSRVWPRWKTIIDPCKTPLELLLSLEKKKGL